VYLEKQYANCMEISLQKNAQNVGKYTLEIFIQDSVISNGVILTTQEEYAFPIVVEVVYMIRWYFLENLWKLISNNKPKKKWKKQIF